jgi:hypothetical protein
LCGHQLHRCGEYLQQARQPSKPVIPITPAHGNSLAKAQAPVAGAVAGSAAAAAVRGNNLEQQILKSFSKPGQKKAHSLLKHLKNSKVLTWTPEGEISYRGQPIHHSNIVDLMIEAQRQKPLKHRELQPGLDKSVQALKETNTAKAWLTNSALKKTCRNERKSVFIILYTRVDFKKPLWSNPFTKPLDE